MSNWNKDFKEWVERPLADLNYVYLWADSIDFKLFSNNSKQSILLLMGVNTDGKKELIALEEGDASSVKDWTRCLENTQKRGLSVAKLAISNSESGFFEAVEQLMPKTTCQHCWSYKTDYLLAQLPKAEHTKIKKSLRDIWTCETRVAASKAYTAMTNSLKGHKDAKDTMSACRTQMLNYYDFPTHHWQFIRSTTLLESIFTSVLPKKNEQRQSTKDQNTLLSMIGQLSKVAENRSTKVKGFKLLAEVSNGVKFKDGQSVSK
jgi:transposase-like protein